LINKQIISTNLVKVFGSTIKGSQKFPINLKTFSA